MTAYLVAETVSTPLYGKLGDVIGRKRVLIAAIVLFLTGSALSGLAGSMLELILFRALQGLGAGGLIVTAMAVIADLVPPRERARYMGMIGGVFAVASVAGPAAGRLLRGPAVLALGLLREPARGRGGAVRDRRQAAVRAPRASAAPSTCWAPRC